MNILKSWGIVNNCYTNRPKRAGCLRRKSCKILSIIFTYIASIIWGIYPVLAEKFVPQDKDVIKYFYTRYTEGKLIKIFLNFKIFKKFTALLVLPNFSLYRTAPFSNKAQSIPYKEKNHFSVLFISANRTISKTKAFNVSLM